ncbi:bifunctional dihydrofolate reductase/thymidilate synthase [Theileria orientalis]|uniref:Bifunctional dihydrofolate reductase-thymidylate synthase n=1 Tax=Theileria orientalis TaxID=68886 RepID=A0A976QVS7_THEOR|nr:bifunctional dihydrofolate reductase/thymidilate synthase [Theileria orientalis]
MGNDYTDLPPIKILAGITPENGIGNTNGLPWPHIKRDFLYMFRLTTYVDPSVKQNNPEIQNVVVIGRKTYDSLPPNTFPFKNRISVVISRTISEIPGGYVFDSIPKALLYVKHNLNYYKIFIMGGSFIYNEVINLPVLDTLYITRVNKKYPCDVFFPKIPEDYIITGISKTFTNGDTTYDFVTYERKDQLRDEPDNRTFHELLLTGEKFANKPPLYKACPNLKVRYSQELQYLDILADILNNGVKKTNRTGVDCYAKFGYQMRFDLSESFPLLTTKKVFLRGIIEELIWFIRGSTNGNDLLKKNVKIWELNGARGFLDALGFYDREEHDLGPVYGFQWRHFGAKYVDMHTDYNGQGIDQLSILIDKIKNKPNDRRLIVCSWNVADLSKMALPPCHLLFQFFVADGKLSCMMHQRSCDMGLGVPFNIASYSLLTYMIAQICDLEPGEFVHNLGDAHIYCNHVDAVKEQISRVPYPFPSLKLNKEIKKIEDFTLDDIKVENYVSHPAIKMDMAA